jgi:hypothetical protein
MHRLHQVGEVVFQTLRRFIFKVKGSSIVGGYARDSEQGCRIPPAINPKGQLQPKQPFNLIDLAI